MSTRSDGRPGFAAFIMLTSRACDCRDGSQEGLATQRPTRAFSSALAELRAVAIQVSSLRYTRSVCWVAVAHFRRGERCSNRTRSQHMSLAVPVSMKSACEGAVNHEVLPASCLVTDAASRPRWPTFGPRWRPTQAMSSPHTIWSSRHQRLLRQLHASRKSLVMLGNVNTRKLSRRELLNVVAAGSWRLTSRQRWHRRAR